MSRRKDDGLEGQKFGRLTALRKVPAPKTYGRRTPLLYYECRCSCGKTVTVRGYALLSGTKSCGCFQRDKVSVLGVGNKRRYKHGASTKGPLYHTYLSWEAMKSRCYRTTHSGYRYYGAKGIVVCDRWRDSFEAFLEDMGPRPEGASLDRADNSLSYSPGNCRWVDGRTQSRNREFNRLVSYNGQTMCVSEWAARLNMNVQTLFNRINRGWSIERALTASVKKKRR